MKPRRAAGLVVLLAGLIGCSSGDGAAAPRSEVSTGASGSAQGCTATEVPGSGTADGVALEGEGPAGGIALTVERAARVHEITYDTINAAPFGLSTSEGRSEFKARSAGRPDVLTVEAADVDGVLVSCHQVRVPNAALVPDTGEDLVVTVPAGDSVPIAAFPVDGVREVDSLPGIAAGSSTTTTGSSVYMLTTQE